MTESSAKTELARETGTPHHKIVDLDTLARHTAQARAEGQRVVLCHGVFDLLHIGHMRYFERARELGDRLVVTVTPDRYVDKGAFRPAFAEDLRSEAIAALSVVDHVALNNWPTAEQTLRMLQPAVYAKGAEFRRVGADNTGKMELERAVAAEIGCELAFVDDVVFSSSQLINLHLRSYPEEVADYLATLRARWSATDVVDLLDRIAKLSVLVVGPTVEETIVEVECLGLGHDNEPILRTVAERPHLAGAPVLAGHLASFAGSVELLTLSDEQPLGSELPGVRTHARPATTGQLRQQRFVDNADGKVWLTTTRGAADEAGDMAWVADRLVDLAPDHDLVLVVDHGQSWLDPALSPKLPFPELAGAYVAHLPDDGRSALPKVDLVLWRHTAQQRKPLADARTVGRVERGGATELCRAGKVSAAPSFGESDAESSFEAYAAVCCLAAAAGAEPELTLLAAQANRLLLATGDPVPSRERLLKQLTSMLK